MQKPLCWSATAYPPASELHATLSHLDASIMATRTLPVLFLGLCCSLLLQVAAFAAPVPTTTPAMCKLHLEGYGNRTGIKSAQLSCTGGNITAAADAVLLKALGSQTPQGVTWSSQKTKCDNGRGICLFSICDGAATFVKPMITDVKITGPKGGVSMCIYGGNVTLVDGTFLNSTGMCPVSISGNATAVRIARCNFSANSIDMYKGHGGALYVTDGAHAIISSSTFVGNAAYAGGAIAARFGARVNIQGCATNSGGRVESLSLELHSRWLRSTAQLQSR